MQPFTTLDATAVALPADNIDTDQILPGRFLKTLDRKGLGTALFHNSRWLPDGTLNHGFVLNKPAAARASILVAGANFGCGSSREHAPWALLDFGFRAVIAPGFADIFYNNAVNCGLLPAVVTAGTWPDLVAAADGRTMLRIDLPTQTIRWHDRETVFAIGTGAKRTLALGLDMIGATLGDDDAIAAFEARRNGFFTWLP